MIVRFRLGFLFLVPLITTGAASAQQSSPPTPLNDNRITIDVVVTPKSGPPVTGLHQQDFTLLDNKIPRPISSFQALGRGQGPLEVILVVDAINTAYQNVDFEREEIDKFLRADGGRLAYPTTLAVLTDAGIQQIYDGFSINGKVLSASLDQHTVSLRSIGRSTGFWGADERFQISIEALRQLAAGEATRPGRKIILWVSPGWPLLSGPDVYLDAKQQQEVFQDIVNFSTLLLRAHITLYSIDPLGSRDFSTRAFYYQEFLKGITDPGHVDVGDLALQVFAIHSGGLALTLSNDVTALLQKCLSDTDAYYEISFDPPLDAKRNEYHHLEIRLTQRGVTARTLQGYYTHPVIKDFKGVPISPPQAKSR